MFILSHELAQRSNLKIYLALLCTGRNIHNHRNQDLFESSSSRFAQCLVITPSFVGGETLRQLLSVLKETSGFLVRK